MDIDKDKSMSSNATDLRHHAEEQLNEKTTETGKSRQNDEAQRTLHELQVHQIELEMQNEELQRAMVELREHEAHLHNIIKMTPAGYFHIDLEGRFLEVNDAWLRMHGYDSADEVIGKHFSIMQVDSDSDSALRHMAELQRGMPIPSGEFTSRRRNGSVGYHTFSAHPVVQFSKIVGFEWFIIDVSNRRLAEEELQMKNAEIERFIYTASHDLRSPLVTVNTFLGYLEEDMLNDNRERLAQDITFIKGATDKMKMLLDELLEMSRIGRIAAPSVRVSLGELLAETLAVLAGSIREQNVDIRLPDTDLILFGDRQRLCEIWQNLIENALKYRCQGTVPRIELGVQLMNGETVFSVKDNGIGIEPQYLKKIFGIFEKLDQKSSGAGMGLSMIQRIVENCGGRVWAESEGSGKGSCFFFTLPTTVVES